MKHAFLCLMLLMLSPSSAGAKVHRALIFGLGEQADKRWGKIHGDNDVYYVERMLRSMGYTDIRTLKNRQATKQALVAAFESLAARCRKGDIVYIHYSGHGQLMTDLNGDEALRWDGRHAQWDEAWIPYDAYMVYGKEDRGEKHFSDDEVAELLMKIRSKIGSGGQITVVVDACHSGDATCGPGDECVRGVDVKFNIPKTPAVPAAAPEEHWRTISACRPYQLCTEMKSPKVGKLTYALYSLGESVLGMSNEKLEETLEAFIDKHKGVLPQQPMVSGKRQYCK